MRSYFQTAILSVPENGRLTMPLELDFTANATVDVDIEAELMDPGGIGSVQGIFVDNQIGDPLTLQFFNSSNQGYVLRLPGKVQTWQPLLIPAGVCRFTALSVARLQHIIQIALCNFPVQPIMWNIP